jgi:hypothetical protein
MKYQVIPYHGFSGESDSLRDFLNSRCKKLTDSDLSFDGAVWYWNGTLDEFAKDNPFNFCVIRRKPPGMPDMIGITRYNGFGAR